jgi:hypothetical protein
VTLIVARKPPVILKIVPKDGHEMYTEEYRPMREKESKNRVRLSGKSLEAVSAFK